MAEVSHGDFNLLVAAEKGDYSGAVQAIKNWKADVNVTDVRFSLMLISLSHSL